MIRNGDELTSPTMHHSSGYEKQDVIRLFDFIDWVMALPEELEEQLWTEIQTIKEEEKMEYICLKKKYKKV